MNGLENAYEAVFTAALIFLGFMLLLCLIRAVRGPRVADRLVAVNMMGTMVMVMIAILALLLAGRLSGGYLYYLRHDKLSCSHCADQGIHGSLSGNQEKRQEKGYAGGGKCS